jgi:hypothetical protein
MIEPTAVTTPKAMDLRMNIHDHNYSSPSQERIMRSEHSYAISELRPDDDRLDDSIAPVLGCEQLDGGDARLDDRLDDSITAGFDDRGDARLDDRLDDLITAGFDDRGDARLDDDGQLERENWENVDDMNVVRNFQTS